MSEGQKATKRPRISLVLVYFTFSAGLQMGPIQAVCLFISKYKEMYGGILKSRFCAWLYMANLSDLVGFAYSNSQRKTHQIPQIRHSEPQKRQYTATEVLLHLF